MLFEYRYFGSSVAQSSSAHTGLSFAPDVRRDPTHLRATLRNKLPFREAISALHDVVVSDLRFRPKDRTAYLAWRAQQDEVDWAEIASMRRDTKAQLDAATAELGQLRARRSGRWSVYERAKKQFFDWLYKKNLDAWIVLDPVITVHPDEVAFECFSQDESSYGRLACSHEVFSHLGELAYGTTNVDYSTKLYDEFQKIRDYKETTLTVDPQGFEVATASDEAYREVKIDLPDSWVRGFLQVGAAMTLPGAVRFRLHPMDVHNFCFQLRRHRERRGPRSMRFFLEPGKPVRVLFEPFGTVIECPRSVYTGREAAEIRVWGRRRLLSLERLVPVARSFDVVLLGTGMPSFWIADCGDLSYTLGLSGWTANDWSASANFDLLAARGDVDASTAEAVWNALSGRWLATTKELSDAVGRDAGTVEAAMVQFAQVGRAMYDIHRGVWRRRELARDPLDMSKLRFANDREEEAARLVQQRGVAVGASAHGDGVRLNGRVGKERASLVLDADRRLRQAECTCSFHFQNKLRKGPCAHILALRLAHERRLGEVLEATADKAAERVVKPTAPPPPKPAPGRPNLRVVGRGGTYEDDDDDDDDADDDDDTLARLGSSEEARLTRFLVDHGLIEIDASNLEQLESDLRPLLKRSSKPEQRAEALWALLERASYIDEFFVGDVDELVDLFRMWG